MEYMFIGQNILGGLTLRGLLANNLKPMLVVTRKPKEHPNLVEETCLEYGVPIKTTSNINTDQSLVEKIILLRPDVIFCCSWGDIIREPLLSFPELGWVNFHPSYLPEYRGSSPIDWQLINGEKYGGCTAHFMSQRFDEGNIILQRRVKIDFQDNGETLRIKCGSMMGKLAVECFHFLANHPQFKGIKLDEAKASYYPRRDNNREIDWRNDANVIYNLVRGLSPYPCAVFRLGEKKLRVAQVAITNLVAGDILIGKWAKSEDSKLLVGTSDYFVKIMSLLLSSQIVTDYIAELNINHLESLDR